MVLKAIHLPNPCTSWPLRSFPGTKTPLAGRETDRGRGWEVGVEEVTDVIFLNLAMTCKSA